MNFFLTKSLVDQLPRLLLGVLGMLSVASCSSTSTSTTADAGPIDLTTPVTTLKADVMPLFNGSCGFSSCHGTMASAKGDLFLGSQVAKGADASQVQKLIVGVMSEEDPTMPYVTAGDPTKSFLMHKMDGDQDSLAAMCPMGCLVSMPQGSDPLPSTQRDIVRRWIAQGALDN